MSGDLTLFIKSISHVATAATVRQFFRQVQLEDSDITGLTVEDDVQDVQFLTYPGSTHRYCRVSFRSSAGVTCAMKLNGQMLHGVPTQQSVIDPSLDPTVNPTTLAEQEREEMSRTVCIRNIPEHWKETRVRSYIIDHLQLDAPMDLRVDKTAEGEFFALVLFQRREIALKLLEDISDDNKLVMDSVNRVQKKLHFEPAESVVRVRDPTSIQFGVDLPSLPTVPIAYQSVKQLSINKKVEQAKQRLAEIFKKKQAGVTDENFDFEEDEREETKYWEPEYLKQHSRRWRERRWEQREREHRKERERFRDVEERRKDRRVRPYDDRRREDNDKNYRDRERRDLSKSHRDGDRRRTHSRERNHHSSRSDYDRRRGRPREDDSSGSERKMEYDREACRDRRVWERLESPERRSRNYDGAGDDRQHSKHYSERYSDDELRKSSR